MSEDGSTLAVYKTEVVRDNLNPTWKPVTTSLQRLSNGDPFRPLVLECFDWDKDGSHELIGRAQTSVDDLMHRCARMCVCVCVCVGVCVCVCHFANLLRRCVFFPSCSATSGERLPLINPTFKASKGAAYTNSGMFRVLSGSVVPQPSFLDYVTGGCELSFMVSMCVYACMYARMCMCVCMYVCAAVRLLLTSRVPTAHQHHPRHCIIVIHAAIRININ